MHLATYLGLLHAAEDTLADAFTQVADGHGEEPDVEATCRLLARWSRAHVAALAPVVARYAEQREDEPDRLHAAAMPGTRTGGVGLLRDLQDLHVLASFVDVTWTVVGRAGQGLRDRELVDVVQRCEQDTARQLRWVLTRLTTAAPQALIAAS